MKRLVLFVLEGGRKGSGDIVVRVTAYGEVLRLSEWLFIGKCFLDSEASYYPVSRGFLGRAMLLNALNELAHGVPFERVCLRYGLNPKVRVVDKRRAGVEARTVRKLHEVL